MNNTDTTTQGRRRLVIIGGGFGGLNLAKYIDKKQWDVILVDHNNYHSFPPLFYQVAASSLEPASITFPLRREMRRRKLSGCRYHFGTVKRIDPEARTVSTQFETLSYDKLVIASGTTNNFFNIPGLAEKVYTLKSVPESIRCRNAILDRLERACLEHDPEKRRKLLTFSVIGGGPTGVEIAGALGEMKRFVVPREYKSFKREEVRVIIVEGTDRLLRTMSEKSSADALKALEKLMVDVRLNVAMKDYTEDGRLILGDGSEIETGMLIWTAGILGTDYELAGDSKFRKAPGNRIVVDEYNQVEGFENIYAIGDIAYHADEEYPHGVPQLAQGAIQQGRRLAKNLNNPDAIKPFRYKDKGSMATIGRNRAVVDIGKLHFSGWIAWMAWMLVHLVTLLGMRNKTVVLINWTWSYFAFSSALRLLLHPAREPSQNSGYES